MVSNAIIEKHLYLIVTLGVIKDQIKRASLLCTPKFYAILKIYRMGDTLEWILVSLMWLFTLLTVFIIASTVAFAIWLIYFIFQSLQKTDPYDLGDSDDP